MWFIGVEVEQETSAPPPKKILDPPLGKVGSLLAYNLCSEAFSNPIPNNGPNICAYPREIPNEKLHRLKAVVSK